MPVDIRHQVDGVFRAANRGEHLRKDLVAVAEDIDLVALCGRDTDERFQVTSQPGSISRRILLACRHRQPFRDWSASELESRKN